MEHEDLNNQETAQLGIDAFSSRLSKLPKWAQFEFEKKERQVKELEYKLEQAEKANKITSTMDWFTLGFHMKEARTLFILHKDAPSKVATVGERISIVGQSTNGLADIPPSSTESPGSRSLPASSPVRPSRLWDRHPLAGIGQSDRSATSGQDCA